MPDSWLEELDEYRAAKDEFFRTHPDSPLSKEQKKQFKGLRYFPANPVFKVKASLERLPELRRVELLNNKSEAEVFFLVGRITFRILDLDAALLVYRPMDSSAEDSFVPFRDKTSGVSTSVYGRWVDLGDWQDRITVDFNYSYHPYCVYNPNTTCPFPPPENDIPIAIEAGEQNP